jgi:hypothetical protein
VPAVRPEAPAARCQGEVPRSTAGAEPVVCPPVPRAGQWGEWQSWPRRGGDKGVHPCAALLPAPARPAWVTHPCRCCTSCWMCTAGCRSPCTQTRRHASRRSGGSCPAGHPISRGGAGGCCAGAGWGGGASRDARSAPPGPAPAATNCAGQPPRPCPPAATCGLALVPVAVPHGWGAGASPAAAASRQLLAHRALR